MVARLDLAWTSRWRSLPTRAFEEAKQRRRESKPVIPPPYRATSWAPQVPPSRCRQVWRRTIPSRRKRRSNRAPKFPRLLGIRRCRTTNRCNNLCWTSRRQPLPLLWRRWMRPRNMVRLRLLKAIWQSWVPCQLVRRRSSSTKIVWVKRIDKRCISRRIRARTIIRTSACPSSTLLFLYEHRQSRLFATTRSWIWAGRRNWKLDFGKFYDQFLANTPPYTN